MSWYLVIRGDSNFSRFTPTAPLVDFLAALSELQQTGPLTFGPKDGQPWVSVILASCNSTGNYGNSPVNTPQVNIVELICSNASDPAWYDALASRIAQYLGWSVFEDNANRQVWPPLDQISQDPPHGHSQSTANCCPR